MAFPASFAACDDGSAIPGLSTHIHGHSDFFSSPGEGGKFGPALTGCTAADMALAKDASGMEAVLRSIHEQFKDVAWLKKDVVLASPADAKQNQKDIQKRIWHCSKEAVDMRAGSEATQPVCLLMLPADGPPVIEVRGPLKLRSRVVLHVPEGKTVKFVGTHRDYLTCLVEEGGEAVDREQLALTWFEASPIRGYHPPFQTDITMENYTGEATIEFVGFVGKGSLDGGFAEVWKENAMRFFDFKSADIGPTQTYIRDHIKRDMAVENRIIAGIPRADIPEKILIKDPKVAAKAKKNIAPLRETAEGTEWAVPDGWPCARPVFFDFFRATGVIMHGVTVKHSPMWSIHPVLSRNVWIHGITVFTRGFNNDGVDPDMSNNVLIEHCTLSPSDDGVAIKAGRDMDGYDPPALRATEPNKQMYCEGTEAAGPEHITFSPASAAAGARKMGPRTWGVIVRGCKVLGDLALPGEEGAPKPPEGYRNGIGIGSEGSAGVENVWLLGLEFSDRATGVCLKTNPERRGIYSGVHIQGIKMNLSPKGHAISCHQDALMRTLKDRAKKGEGPLPDFQQNHMTSMRFEAVTATKLNCHCCGGGKAIDAVAYGYKPEGASENRFCPFQGLEVTDCVFTVEAHEEDPGMAIKGVSKLKIKNVTMNGVDILEEHEEVLQDLSIKLGEDRGRSSAPYLAKYFDKWQEILFQDVPTPEKTQALRAEADKFLEQSFNHHDVNGNGELEPAEAAAFFKNLVHADGDFIKTFAQRALVLLMASPGGDLPVFMDKLKIEIAKATKDYADNMAERNAAAFRVVDTSGDGEIQLEEFLCAMDAFNCEAAPTPKSMEFLSALGFDQEKIMTAVQASK